jgi:glutathione S-transferase
MSLLERIVVTYWKIPGGGLAAPVVMLCHYVGQQVFEEYMDKERWNTYKETTRWGQLPIFTLEYREGTLKDSEDDKATFTNSLPALRSIGNTFGMYFTELKQAFRYQTDVWMDVGKDCMHTLHPSLHMKDNEEKLEARKKLMAEDGKLYGWFKKFDNELKKLNEKNEELIFLVNNTISIADFHFFATINSITCGWIDGVDKNFLQQFTYLYSYYERFLKHYQERLESNPKKEEYPYVVHNGRFYVNGKDETEFWANKDNHIPEEQVKEMNFTGVGYENKKVETHNVRMTEEQINKLNLDIKKEVNEEVKEEVKEVEEVLTRESTLLEVENASVKLLKNTLKKHNKSTSGVTEKHELIGLVKEVLINLEESSEPTV